VAHHVPQIPYGMEEKPASRLILVSNRLPFQLVEKSGKVSLRQSDGGLVTALKSYFERDSQNTFNQKIWLGSADFTEKRWQKYKESNPEPPTFSIEPIFIDPKVYSKYYNGFCNATLWPLFHYFITYTVFDEDSFESYEHVNQLIADRLAEMVQPGDIIWIHDYQLFLVPDMLRQRVRDVSIGFFLHIPFPSFEIFRLLHRHWKEKILRGLLGADLIGFHTNEYVQHFLKTVRMTLGYDHQYRSVTVGNRIVKTDLFPLGIDFEKFHSARQQQEIVNKRDEILSNFGNKKIIFSVDRLDYTKGVTHRLQGFERFLEKFPEWHEKVVFVLVIVPSRQIISKYNERKRMIEELVGSINGKYSSLQWQPIIYRYNHLEFNDLSALYQAAHVGLITPLRDGMNLVAKEYVASCGEDGGVLILSELAGAASELGEALLVNPMEIDEVARAINEALTMPAADQTGKIKLMQRRLIEYDVQSWVVDFLNQMHEVKRMQHENVKTLNQESIHELVINFQKANSRLLFLDYDGTLVPFARHPRDAKPTETVLNIVSRLAGNKRNHVTIISGRDSNVLSEWFGNTPVTLVAEHGASVRQISGEWEHLQGMDESWKQNIRPTLELFAKRCPGSFVEEKNHTLAWHYRNVQVDLGFMRSRELLDSLLHLVRNAQLQVIDGNKVIEVRVAGIDKGNAAKAIVEREKPDFTLVMGDDKTDEDMFSALQSSAITIKVGPGITSAQYVIPSQQEVIRLLELLN
jgi:trehalose 6-phosphate synthase/phosphatase